MNCAFPSDGRASEMRSYYASRQFSYYYSSPSLRGGPGRGSPVTILLLPPSFVFPLKCPLRCKSRIKGGVWLS